jgi:histidinol-phosphate aminotransferase
MAGYAPGEQPRAEEAFIKLNTNENPYPPSPRVLDAVRAALTGDRLRKYPDPLGTSFRRAAGRLHGVDPDRILIGNGADDILTMVTRTFVPEGGLVVSPTPSYLLYPALAAIQGAHYRTVSYKSDWGLPEPWPSPEAHLTFVCNPNSPSGTTVAGPELGRLGDLVAGALVVDETYADFAGSDVLHLADRPNVVVARSLSKAYSLAGIRFGYAVARPELVRELLKVKDSYNCDVLSLAAAEAALEDQDYRREIRAHILATRDRLKPALEKLGFDVCPSQTNFLWCRRADRPVKPLYEELKRRKILVRYINYEGHGDGLRISVGSNAEIDRLLAELARLV